MPTYAVLAPYMSHPAVIEAGSPREAAAEFADRHDEVLKDGAHPDGRDVRSIMVCLAADYGTEAFQEDATPFVELFTSVPGPRPR